MYGRVHRRRLVLSARGTVRLSTLYTAVPCLNKARQSEFPCCSFGLTRVRALSAPFCCYATHTKNAQGRFDYDLNNNVLGDPLSGIYISVSPITLWEISFAKDFNQFVDTSGITKIFIKFEGRSKPLDNTLAGLLGCPAGLLHGCTRVGARGAAGKIPGIEGPPRGQ